ncbi:MAG: tetratricopeptide repeat protein [Candidatus Kerfeldbacteria bacterium]|nr:tetratricopeptide repeat protein [Candidatus Kerfeldbacteria bacterium]
MDFTDSLAGSLASGLNKPAAYYLDKILVWGLRLLVFLVPIFFLPWTSEIFEFNKQFILITLGVILLAFWVSRGVVARETIMVKSWLNWAVLAFLVVFILATIFSIDPITSVLGFYGRFNGGLLSLVAYLVMYFLVLQTVTPDSSQSIHWLLGSWLTGVGLGAVVLLLQLFGLRWLPFAAGQLSSFTPLGGSLNSVALLLAASLPLALYLSQAAKTVWGRVLSVILAVLSLVLLFIVDYQLGWIGLIVGAVVWLGLVFWKNESVSSLWTLVPAVALLLAVIAWPLATPVLTRLPVPVEINLSLGSSWKIALQNVKASPWLGSGPETFIYGFSKYKPENFNDSNFWAFRFDKASSELAQLTATAGFLGLASYIAILLLALYAAWRTLRDKTKTNWFLGAAVASSFLVLIVGSVFYFSNTVLAVNFWLLLGILGIMTSTKKRTVSLTNSPRASFLFSFGLAVVALAVVGICFVVARFWLADAAYSRAQVASSKLETLDTASNELLNAITLNPWRDVYRIGLAQVFLGLANREANLPVGKTDEEKQTQLQRLQSYIASSIAAARSATELTKQNVANWEALGSIYRGTVLFARDAEDWVIDSFAKAVTLEPSNPALYTELGKAYLVSASRGLQEASQTKDEAAKAKLNSEAVGKITKAIEQFDKAIALKADYTPAQFNEVLALELQNKIDDAITKLLAMRDYNPQDVDVLYELASLYLTKNDFDKAQEAFSTITALVPNHANAHYGLAVVYVKKGDKDNAIKELQRVLELNPGNQDIQKQLDGLKNGTIPVGNNPVTPTPPPAAPAPAKSVPPKK